MQHSWNQIGGIRNNIVSSLSAKFKRLRYDLKQWSKGLSNIKLQIENYNKVILYIDTFEEYRNLFNTEWNLRKIKAA
jgi:phosphotransferase system IIB component